MGDENKNGLPDDLGAKDTGLQPVARNPLVAAFREIADKPLAKLSDASQLAVVSIMSVGAIVELHHFQDLCFLHPDVANQWVPAVIGVVAPFVVKIYLDRKGKNEVPPKS